MGLPLRGTPPRWPQMGNVVSVPKPRVRRTTFARRSSGSVQPAGSLLSSRAYRTAIRGGSRSSSASRMVTVAGTAIGSAVTATDPDAGNTLTYTLDGKDSGHFAIDADSGQLQTSGALDYESKDSYAVTVTAADSGGLSASVEVTITVTDVADTPPGQPAAPEIIDVEKTSFLVTWTAPAAGSSAISGYGIQYKLTSEADSAYADAKPTKAGTVTGYNVVNRNGQSITAGTSYAVRVRARNAQGWGPWSETASVVTAGAASGGGAAPANGDEAEADDSGEEEPADGGGSYQATAHFITNQGRVLVNWDEVDGAAYHLIGKNGQPMPGRTDATTLYDADVEEGARYVTVQSCGWGYTGDPLLGIKRNPGLRKTFGLASSAIAMPIPLESEQLHDGGLGSCLRRNGGPAHQHRTRC